MRIATGCFIGALLLCLLVAGPGFNAVCLADAAGKAAVTQSGGFYERIMKLLQAAPKEEVLPQVVAVKKKETPIFGVPEVTKEQMIRHIERNNPLPQLACPLAELVEAYYEEAAVEGIRPDLALAQAVLETGYFRYGGDVLPEQNNYAGIGTSGGGKRGVWFGSPRLGVRAHIQHLLVYSSTREPVMPIADPRYDLVRTLPAYFAQCPTWESLGGKWAIPGINYGERIIKIVERAKFSG